MDYQELAWEREAEGIRTCCSCSEEKGPEVIFVHDVCTECHEYDNSDCEICYPRSIK